CICPPNTVGERSDECAPNHWAGCKANIQGLKCDKCKLGTFGLSTRNPLGCSQCYCFGMTSTCTEAQGLIRMWVSRVMKKCDRNAHTAHMYRVGTCIPHHMQVHPLT
uniref:Laminin EGF-like domain-containing protein n=1 Tax=Hucho hucho TaxID=62062 RepID=A0A4W5P015_9TELE